MTSLPGTAFPSRTTTSKGVTCGFLRFRIELDEMNQRSRAPSTPIVVYKGVPDSHMKRQVTGEEQCQQARGDSYGLKDYKLHDNKDALALIEEALRGLLSLHNLRDFLLFLGNLLFNLLLLSLNLCKNLSRFAINLLPRLVCVKHLEDVCGLMNLFEQIRGFDVVTLIITLGLWEGSTMLARVE